MWSVAGATVHQHNVFHTSDLGAGTTTYYDRASHLRGCRSQKGYVFFMLTLTWLIRSSWMLSLLFVLTCTRYRTSYWITYPGFGNTQFFVGDVFADGNAPVHQSILCWNSFVSFAMVVLVQSAIHPIVRPAQYHRPGFKHHQGLSTRH